MFSGGRLKELQNTDFYFLQEVRHFWNSTVCDEVEEAESLSRMESPEIVIVESRTIS